MQLLFVKKSPPVQVKFGSNQLEILLVLSSIANVKMILNDLGIHCFLVFSLWRAISVLAHLIA